MSRRLSLRCGIALFFFRALLGDKHFPLLWQQRVDRRGVGFGNFFNSDLTNSKILLYNFEMIVGKLGGEFAFSTMGDCADSFLSGGPGQTRPVLRPARKRRNRAALLWATKNGFCVAKWSGLCRVRFFFFGGGEGVMGGEFGLWTH